jgi:hypothetical protein
VRSGHPSPERPQDRGTSPLHTLQEASAVHCGLRVR